MVLAKNHVARSHALWAHQSRRFIIYEVTSWDEIPFKKGLKRHTYTDAQIQTTHNSIGVGQKTISSMNTSGAKL